MDNQKTGELIRHLRTALGLTQLQLAERLGVSDKAVSKWERGLGCPDVVLMPELAEVLGISIDTLLDGELPDSGRKGDNMKNTVYYVCPQCGNIITAAACAEISCCGRRLQQLAAQKPDQAHELTIEQVEDELYITAAHPMTKEHYIAFAAVVSGGVMTLYRQYPEWNMQLRIPARTRGLLLWYCTEHGLFRRVLSAPARK
ncbi:MAG: helix-turn-helix domain-containing protein [Ruminococcaceae bacterium]|nr:helix-turn-helix domain-containing protein [Oscillospiraceae bacterium]